MKKITLTLLTLALSACSTTKSASELPNFYTKKETKSVALMSEG